MAQQLINVGVTANDGTGDNWRDAFIKTNANDTELYANLAAQAQNLTVINSEADFPTQDASTITLEANTEYFIGTAFSTAKTFTVQTGVSLKSINPFSTVITYTGTGTMFNSSGASWELSQINVSAPTGTLFSYTGPGVFFTSDTRIAVCANMGTFTPSGTTSIVINNSAVLSNTGQGIVLNPGSFRILSILQFFQLASSVSHVGIDLTTAAFDNFEAANLSFIGPSGSVGISGAASSANVAVNAIATVSNCSLNGNAMTPLSGVAVTDIRWSFDSNSGIPDTIEDALVSLTNNATETVIAVVDTPVLVAGTWVCERQSLFDCTTAGRATYIGERDITLPIDLTTTIIAASGINQDIHTYLAINGSIVTNSGVKNRVGATDPGNTTVLWQSTLSKDDYVEIYIENNTGTTNLIAEDGALRVR